MTDREMLELAAKAADYPEGSGWLLFPEGSEMPGNRWNPLTDDGDAFRLAVKMQISPEFWLIPLGVDACAATRRFIVRAAAEIGKAL